MKRTAWWCGLALIIAMAGKAPWLYPQAKEAGGKPAQPAAAKKKAAGPSPEEMMAAVAKYGTPGEAHKRLNVLAGSWNAQARFWEPGSETAGETKGTSEKKWILDGRFLYDDYKSEYMGKPFVGMGLTGYDNLKGQYIGVWGDSMSTSLWVGQGKADASGKVITLAGIFDDPVKKKKVNVRAITRIIDDNKHIFEWHEPGPDGKERKALEVTYTRK